MKRLFLLLLFAHLLFMPVAQLSQPERYDGWSVEIDGPDDSMYFYMIDEREDDIDLDPSGGLTKAYSPLYSPMELNPDYTAR